MLALLTYLYEMSSAAEWFQEALQKSCKRAGCSSSKFWLFNAAVESSVFDNDKQSCCIVAENCRIMICAAEWLQKANECCQR